MAWMHTNSRHDKFCEPSSGIGWLNDISSLDGPVIDAHLPLADWTGVKISQQAFPNMSWFVLRTRKSAQELPLSHFVSFKHSTRLAGDIENEPLDGS